MAIHLTVFTAIGFATSSWRLLTIFVIGFLAIMAVWVCVKVIINIKQNTMNRVNEYIETNKERFLEELFELLRIPSISAQSDHRGDMVRCAEWLRDALLGSGADRAEVMPTAGNPVVYAEKIIDPALPTVLVYGHYDVMPVDPLNEWNTDPFEPVIKDGRIYARGANDDKGQLYMHAKAFETMVATDTLPCNIKFMIEGEEEIGSASLYGFCEGHKELLKSDIILVSDTSLIGWEIPSITAGLRGLTYMQIEVQGPAHDLHSGLYGGAVANPANVLADIIARLVDEQGRITIPGFYDDVRELTATERADFNKAPFDLEKYKRQLDVDDVQGEEGYTTVERTGVRPTLDVNGIWGGYTGEGTKTIIPATASAKISMRLVPNQDYHKIAELFTRYVESIAPKSVRVKCEFLHGGAPYVSPTDLPAYQAAARAMEETFGKRPLPFYSGGSIPIVSGFEQILGVKSILMGFGLDIDAIHSPNESYGLENFYRGIETIPLFFRYFAKTN
jgi:acetylornithine deacetylase/succinyl-diaminopimelate desuccinylase-like protein